MLSGLAFLSLAYLLELQLQQRLPDNTENEDESEEEELESEIEDQAPGPLKRTFEDVDTSETQQGPGEPIAAKRSRVDDFDDFGFAPHATKPTLSHNALALALPPPSNTIIQLRFQLCGFEGVYRVVEVPLSFTFAHLYRFMLLIFGWSGDHLHQAQVVTHAELYSPNGPRKGEVKKHRSFRIPVEPAYEEREEWRHWSLTYARREHDPVMRVTPVGVRKKPTLPNPDDPWDVLFSHLEVPVKKDAEVTLGDVWATKRSKNASLGDCSNRKIAIMFEYDFGSSWDVHVTVEPDKDDEYLWKLDAPRNHPIITVAKGGPPVEDAHDDSDEIDAKKKRVSPLLFTDTIFERFLSSAVYSVAREEELVVIPIGEEEPQSVSADDEHEDGAADESSSLRDQGSATMTIRRRKYDITYPPPPPI